MNICIINVDYQPEYIGGIQRVSRILAKEWQENNNHDVYFLTMTPSSDRISIVNGIPQFFFPDSVSYDSDINLNYFYDFIKLYNIDIVINQHVEEYEICNLCYKVKEKTNIKLISTLHFSPTHKKDITSNSFFISYKLGSKIKRYFIDFLLYCKFWLYTNYKNEKEEKRHFNSVYLHSDKVVLLSDKYIPIFIKKAKLDRTDKLIAISNPSLSDNKEVVYEKKKIIIWCGRLGYDAKRLDKMLSIWKKISQRFPDWQLKILGSGDKEYFRKIIDKFRIRNIEIVGFSNPYNYYRNASIICMTSVCEGLPMVLIEAINMGCVPIAYNSFASLSDVIDDGRNGYIITPFNEKEYINRLSSLMSNPALLRQMAESGRELTYRFDMHKIAHEWDELFRDCVAK